MKTIYKYPIAAFDAQTVSMPVGAQILTVQVQDETPCIWALVDATKPSRERVFELFGTGHPFYEDMGIERAYIGTFQLQGGSLVFHLFERL